MLKKCKANNAEAIQFHALKLGVVEQLHTRYKSIKFHGNLKNECILLVGLTWNYPAMLLLLSNQATAGLLRLLTCVILLVLLLILWALITDCLCLTIEMYLPVLLTQ